MNLELLSSLSSTRRYERGEVILWDGDVGDEMFLVLAGSVGVYKNYREEGEVQVGTIAAGGFFGEMTLFLKARRSATVVALEELSVLVISEAGAGVFFRQEPDTVFELIAMLCQRLSDLNVSFRELHGAFKLDPFTKLYNRETFDSILGRMVSQHAPGAGNDFCLLIFDIDKFKTVNDTYGHSYGDEVILALVACIKAGIRSGDYAFRYGGEEFAAIITAGRDQAVEIAENVRLQFGRQAIGDHPDKRFTVSVGVAEMAEGLSVSDLFCQADGALYQAKEGGRNRVVVATGEQEDCGDSALGQIFPPGHSEAGYRLPFLEGCGPLEEKALPCPICGQSFTTLVPREGVPGEDPCALCYDVITCPHCHYSGFSASFGDAFPARREATRKALAPFARLVVNPLEKRDAAAVFTSYYLALVCAPLCMQSAGLYTAPLWRGLFRLYRAAGDGEMADFARQNAIKEYDQTLMRGQYPPGERAGVLYLLGELCAEGGDDDLARGYYGRCLEEDGGLAGAVGAALERLDANAHQKGCVVRLLGTRGSIPTAAPDRLGYGGSTTCVLVQMGGELIFLDAGTGLTDYALARLPEGPIHILLSHTHLDHIIGISSFAPLADPAREVHIYGASRGGLSIRQQLDQMMAPPLWPVGLDMATHNTFFYELEEEFSIGPVSVRTLEGDHPGGCTLFRLACGRRSLVFATDFEHGERTPALESFAKSCDLLLYDAHFTDAEYEKRRGWGHSTWQQGAALGARCAAGQTLLFHHKPGRTDAELDELGGQLAGVNPSCRFARENEEILL